MNKLIRTIASPKLLAGAITRRNIGHLLPDDIFIRVEYYAHMGKKLDLKSPQTYNEKLQWLKLYNRKSDYIDMVDKYTAKLYVSKIIGSENVIPTLGVWNTFDEIDFDKLPQQFVLKPTHTSGDVFICKDKTKIDKTQLKATIDGWLKRNYFLAHREWPYKNVKPRIIAEEYMVDESGCELKDYKFFCFNGVPKTLFVATDRPYATKFDFFDMDFNHLPITNGHPNATKAISKPTGFEEMKEISARLSSGIPHVRIDLYDINGRVYFGEMTFFHWGGLVPFEPEQWDAIWGKWIDLPKK